MKTKTKPIPKEELFPLLLSIQKPKLQVYSGLLYWLACRSGEILPYTHYKTTYKRLKNGKLDRDINNNLIVLSRVPIYDTQGIEVSTIKVEEDRIEFDKIPVFKSDKDNFKTGIVPAKNNPLYKQILNYVLERKAIQQVENQKAINSGNPPRTVYLFETEINTETPEQFYWRFNKMLYRFLKKKGYTVHSLRKTRATIAGNISGDPYYVQSLTGHASINMASEYVAKKKLFDSMKRYEGF